MRCLNVCRLDRDRGSALAQARDVVRGGRQPAGDVQCRRRRDSFRLLQDASDDRGGHRVRGARQGAGHARQARGLVFGQGHQRHRGPFGHPRRRARRGERGGQCQGRRAPRADARADRRDRGGRARRHPPRAPRRHRRVGARARPAGRCAGARGYRVRRRDRLEHRRRRARGSVQEVRSDRDAASDRVEDLHHQGNADQRRFGAAVDGRGGRRGCLWPRHRADRRSRQGGRMGRRRDARAALRRFGRRALFALVVDRLPRRDRARLGQFRRTARGRGRDGPAFPAHHAQPERARARGVRRSLLHAGPPRRDACDLRL